MVKNFFRISILVLIALNLGRTLFGFESNVVLFLASMTALISGFPLMSKSFQRASTVFLILGISLLAFKASPLQIWMNAASSMINFITIVAVMQNFTIPIKAGGYDEAIKTWIEDRFNQESTLFFLITFTIHVMTSFLNMGSIPVSFGLFEKTLKARIPDWQRFYARAATRGYVLSALWSPGAVNLYLVAQASGQSWSKIFIPGIILAFMGMGASFLAERFNSQEKKSPTINLMTEKDYSSDSFSMGKTIRKGRIFHILIVVGVFIISTALLERLKMGVASGRAVLAGTLIVIIWTLSQSKQPGIKAALKAEWMQGVFKIADIAPFFVAMGFFSSGLEQSGFLQTIAPFLKSASGYLGPFSIILIACGIVACSIIGIHPFITIVLFGRIISYLGLSLPPITVALVLSIGGATSYMITPFAGVIMAIAKLTGKKATDVGLRWNWKFCLLFFCAGMVFAFVWGALFG